MDTRIKDKMQTKLADFKRSDIITMDTESLQELSKAEESHRMHIAQETATFKKERKRMDAFWRRLPN